MNNGRPWLALVLAAALAVSVSAPPLAPPRRAVAQQQPDVVISQIFGGGGNAGAPFTHDFVELLNRGSAPAALDGWSIQYASATGTGPFGANDGQLTVLTGTIPPGRFWLVQEATTAGGPGAPLPQPDLVDQTPINLAAGGGKVALVRSTASLGCNGGSLPCPPEAQAQIVDLVGYGGASYFEGAGPAPAGSNSTAVQRAAGGAQDTNDNGADFVSGPPLPRSSCFPDACPTPTPTPPGAPASPTTTGTPATATPSSSPTPSAPAVSARIRQIQGAAHRSPLEGTSVANVPGVVVARRSNGFYLQDPQPDGSDATAEGIFVFTSAGPAVAVGDAVLAAGVVQEFRPGCTPSCSPGDSAFDNLTITQIGTAAGPAAVRVLSSGNATPTPVVVGAGGRLPPGQVIENDASGDVETSGLFDPAADGLDFYESLEGMLVQLNDAVAVGPRRSVGEIAVVGDGGASAALRTARGGILLRPDDPNPERILIDDLLITTPNVDVGDRFPGPVVGVIDYSFGAYKLLPLALPTPLRAGLAREVTDPAATDELAVATFNVENLDPGDGPAKFAALATQIVAHLRSPDLIALEEVQDNNGPTGGGVVDADQTYATLIAAITAAGGPAYTVRQINPRNGQDGGQPGGNIRLAFLFREDRGLRFVDRPGAGPDTDTAPVLGPNGPQLTFSPGRIQPADPAWENSRKPLAGEFTFNGHTLFAVANHFTSKIGDDPLFGRFQPPVLETEVQRRRQAEVEGRFVSNLLALDPQAKVVVLGDLNDFEFSEPLSILERAGLTTLVETLPLAERYTYVFEGNSQALDHTLVSAALLGRVTSYDVVHVNAEFANPVSDHDPQVTRFLLPAVVPVTPSVSPTPSPVATTPSGTPTPAPTLTPTPSPSPTLSPSSTPSPSATPQPLRVSASGAGTLDVGGESATFAFDVSRAGADGRVLGRLVYRNRGRALMVIGDAITSLDVSGSTATFSGTCTDPATGTPCRFTVRATAGDRFGRGATLTVEVAGAWTDSGTVRGGVIRVLSGPAVTLPVSGRGDGVSAAVAES